MLVDPGVIGNRYYCDFEKRFVPETEIVISIDSEDVHYLSWEEGNNIAYTSYTCDWWAEDLREGLMVLL